MAEMSEISVKTLLEVKEHILEVIQKESDLGKNLWHALLKLHPVDIAILSSSIDFRYFKQLFSRLPKQLRLEVFHELSDKTKVELLDALKEQDQYDILSQLHADELADFFDLLSDSKLSEYMSLLHKSARERVVSIMKFDPDSAGGIMDTQVFSLMQDFTVEKSVKILQRLSESVDVYRQIFITDSAHRLVGFINLEDLVLHPPAMRIGLFMKPNEFIASAEQDQEVIAQMMTRYSLETIPVVGANNHFLGVIPSETLVDVLVEEASEDVQKMAALAPLKQSYFDTPFFKILYDRSYILILLLLIESFSGTILHSFEATLTAFLKLFIPMLVSAGGNTSSQTSAMVIQGMAMGDIRSTNIKRFLRREFTMALFLGGILGLASFGRAYFMGGGAASFNECVVISATLALIVIFSVILGSFIPLTLKRLGVDPAFSAGPFLATIMDVLGILIFCWVSRFILF